MRKFFVLLMKELRELITPQIFVPFVVVIVMFVALGQTLSSVSVDEADTYPLVVADRDGTELSRLVVDALGEAGFSAAPADSALADGDIVPALDDAGANIYLEIPEGFKASIDAGRPKPIRTATRVSNFSFIGSRDIAAFAGAIEVANTAVSARLAEQAAPGLDPQVLRNPVAASESVIVGDRQAETSVMAVMGFVSQQTTFIPIVLFIVIIFAAQMIATAIATEKENKTLETLLSYPVSRASIVTSKMVAAGLIALISAGAYMVGMQQYMKGMEAGLGDMAQGISSMAASEEAMRQLGLTLGPTEYALLGLTLFAGILVALSIAIILGAFAESVKSVQALLTPLMVLLLVPYFLTLFLDLSVLPDAARIGVLAIPFTYPFITGPNLFLGNYAIVWFGIAYQLVWFAAMVTVAARVFSSDRVLTMKLSLKRKRG